MQEFAGYQTVAEIAEVVRKFADCEYSANEFTHAHHLTVAAWYLTQYPPADALDHMRASLLRFTEHYRVTAYHETITRFWLVTTWIFLESHPSESLPARINELVRLHGDKNLLFQHYSREHVMSDLAKTQWVDPDLAPLPQN